MAQDTIVDRLLEKANTQGDEPALHYEEGGEWKSLSWRQYADRAKKFAGAMLDMGCESGAHVNICGYNCPEWVIADVGTMVCGGVPSGIYNTNSPDKLAYIVNHSEAKILVLENKEQWDKYDEVRDEIGDSLKQVVLIRDIDKIDDDIAIGFDDFLARGEEHLDEVDECVQDIDPEALGTMIYTSGTTGPPKGVMISHKNLATTADIANEVVGEDFVGDDDCVVSYLPLSHIAEQMFSIHLAITLGYPIYFAPSLDDLKETLQVARPTLFFAVPRVWEKFKAAIEGQLDEAGFPKSVLLNWARNVGVDGGYEILEHGEPQGFNNFKYNIAKSLVFDKLAGKVGLDRLKIAISAAAPIGRDVLEFFMSLGIIIREVYGQSEDCGPTTFNYPEPGGTKLGTVGKPLPGVDVKLADDGEILVKGPNVFMGYYKNEEETNETLIDGWLHSGDIGEFDDDGFLSITDRKKNIIITSGGKNIAPAPMEAGIKEFDALSQVVVIGDDRKFLSTLVTLDPELAPAMAEKRGWPTDLEELAEHPELLEEIRAHIEKVNGKFARVETVKKFTLLPHEFTQENDELTPTQKVKRRVVTEKYSDKIDAMYKGEGGLDI